MNPELSFNPEHLTKHSSFDFQFNDRERVELSGDSVEIYDIKPEEEKTKIPVFVSPGWAATPEVFEENMRGLVDSGRRVLSVDASHGIGHEFSESDYPDAELRKLAALLECLENKQIEKTDVVAHSEAAIYSIIAAKMHPEKFRNIVLVNPAGLIEEENIRRLSVGFSLDIFREIIRSINEKKIRKPIFNKHRIGAREISKDPVASIKEVFAISSVQIQDMMLDLINSSDVSISIIHAAEDRAFPVEKVKAVADKLGISFMQAAGTHNEVYLNPEIINPLIEKELES